MQARIGTRSLGTTILMLATVLAAGADRAAAAVGVDYSRQGHWMSALALPIEPNYDEDSMRLVVNGDVVYVSGTAYTRASERQYAIDCADPTRPVVTDSLTLYHADVAQCGDFQYVASGYYGMNIVSLADPRHPRLVSHLDLDVRAHYIRVHDGLAYVGSDEDASALVVDVSDPEHPALLGSFDQPWGIRVLEFSGNVGYIADENGLLRIVDLSDPLRPVAIGAFGGPGTIHDMKVVGNLGAVVTNDAVILLGLKEPSQPTRLASVKWPAHSYDQKVHLSDSMVFVSHYWGAVGWDITRPEQPVEIGEIPVMDGFRGLGLGAGRLHMASAARGLPLTISTMDLASRTVVGPGEMTRIPSGSRSFDIEGDLMVSAQDAVLRVTDIGDPSAAVVLGSVDLGGWQWTVSDVDGALAVASSYWNHRIVDISDPAAPVARGLIPGVEVAVVALRGNLAITATDSNTDPNELAVFDLSDPDLPVRVGALGLPRGHKQLLVADNLVVCRADDAVTICDISQPASPRLLSTTNASTLGIGLSGTDLYVGRAQGGFHVYDIADPSLPRLRGFFRTLGLTNCFAFDGDIVYVGDYLHGCQIIDISDVAHPAWVGSLFNPVINEMQVHGDWIHFGTEAAPRHVSHVAAVPTSQAPGATQSAAVYPNPFNPTVVVTYTAVVPGPARVSVLDVAGRRLATIVDPALHAGRREVRWHGELDDGRAAPAGVYVFAIEAGGARQVVKAVLVK